MTDREASIMDDIDIIHEEEPHTSAEISRRSKKNIKALKKTLKKASKIQHRLEAILSKVTEEINEPFDFVEEAGKKKRKGKSKKTHHGRMNRSRSHSRSRGRSNKDDDSVSESSSSSSSSDSSSSSSNTSSSSDSDDNELGRSHRPRHRHPHHGPHHHHPHHGPHHRSHHRSHHRPHWRPDQDHGSHHHHRYPEPFYPWNCGPHTHGYGPSRRGPAPFPWLAREAQQIGPFQRRCDSDLQQNNVDIEQFFRGGSLPPWGARRQSNCRGHARSASRDRKERRESSKNTGCRYKSHVGDCGRESEKKIHGKNEKDGKRGHKSRSENVYNDVGFDNRGFSDPRDESSFWYNPFIPRDYKEVVAKHQRDNKKVKHSRHRRERRFSF